MCFHHNIVYYCYFFLIKVVGGSFGLGATVNAAARCGLWPLAIHLLASPEIEGNVVPWNAAMTACEVGGSPMSAVLDEENQ